MTGHYTFLVAERDRVLSTARMSPAARARVLGKRFYQPIVIKTHTITVDCAKPEERKVESGPPLVAKPALAPPAEMPAPQIIPKQGITIESVQRVFLDVLREAGYQIDGQPYGRMEMICPRRSRAHSWPRQVCMDLVRRLCPASYPVIGRAFGGKDHTTVMCAVNRTPHHLAESPLLADVHAKVLAVFEAKK